jgi:hypothetical protein
MVVRVSNDIEVTHSQCFATSHFHLAAKAVDGLLETIAPADLLGEFC